MDSNITISFPIINETMNDSLDYLSETDKSNNISDGAGIDNYYYYETEQLATLWFLLISIVIGNLSVLLALLLTKRRKSRVNFFIQHLAIADLSVGLVNVLTDLVWKFTLTWNAGNPACKIVRYSQGVVTYSSTYVLVALTIDRYDAIRHPMNFSRGLRQARYLIAYAWTLSCVFASPLLVLFEEKQIQDRSQCWIHLPEPWHWQLYMSLVSITVFFLPAVIIASCYAIIVHTIWAKSSIMIMSKPKCNNNWSSDADADTKRVSSRGIIPKAKVKTIKMTLVIVFVFIACWSPYMIFNLLQVFGVIHQTSQTALAISTFIQSLAPLNSAVNPIIYWCFSTYLCRDLRRKEKWLDSSSRVGRSVRVTDSTSFSESISTSRRNLQILQPLNSVQRKLILRSVLLIAMGLKEQSLSSKARAFLVDNLLSGDSFAAKSVKWNNGISAELCSSDLWDMFHGIGTEMVVTKAGRRMFPTLEFRFNGLCPHKCYIIFIDMVPVGNSSCRYIFQRSHWESTGTGVASPKNQRIFIHPNSPCLGATWMHMSFDKVKLTNNKRPVVRGQISLNSLQRYQPVVNILELPRGTLMHENDLLNYVLENRARARSFSFRQTSFITVTAYQNPQITRLKIMNNPYAKGYRQNACNERKEKCRSEHKTEMSSNQRLKIHQPRRVPVKLVIPPKGLI